MALPIQHLFEQGEVLSGLARTAVAAIRQKRSSRNGQITTSAVVTPGPEVTAVLPPRSAALIRDYVRHVGGDPGAYRNTVPPHLFPQWSFGMAARTLEGVPYPLLKVMNGGCRYEARGPIPAGEPLHVRVRLDAVDDNGQRAILTQRIITGTAKEPDLLTAYLHAYVPLKQEKKDKGERPAKARPRVPEDARELAFWRIPANAGLEFALLTGDFNPVHWIPAYARSFGFPSTILHGFSTMARACEGIGRHLLAGQPQKITAMEVRFVRPLVLPAKVGLYVAEGGKVFVGDAPGGGAYLEGTYQVSK